MENNEELRVRFKSEREEEIRTLVRAFLRQVVVNLVIPEGINGKLDLAFAIDRRRIIAEELIALGKEIKEFEGVELPMKT